MIKEKNAQSYRHRFIPEKVQSCSKGYECMRIFMAPLLTGLKGLRM